SGVSGRRLIRKAPLPRSSGRGWDPSRSDGRVRSAPEVTVPVAVVADHLVGGLLLIRAHGLVERPEGRQHLGLSIGMMLRELGAGFEPGESGAGLVGVAAQGPGGIAHRL